MEKLKKIFGSHPVSASLVLMAVLFNVAAALAGSLAMTSAAVACLGGAVLFGMIFES